MSNEGIPVWDIDEPDLDLGDLVLEDENDALVFSREREMKRWFTPGFASRRFVLRVGLHRDHIDNNAVTASSRMHEEGHYRWDSAMILVVVLCLL